MKPIILITCIFVAGSLAPPPPPSATCSSRCSGIDTKFKFQKGTTYTYKYTSETKVQLSGISQKAATVQLDATAKFSVIDDCDWVLKVSNAKITGPSAAQLGSDWAKDLEKSATRFSYDNGAIEEICPADDEKTHITNLKRGILSTFQVAHEPDKVNIGEYETDIAGRCPTNYESSGTTITKSKNLLECFDHVSNYTSVRMVNYDIRSRLQTIPISDCKQKCTYTIQQDIIQNAECTETHIFTPFKSDQNQPKGLTATIATKLAFTTKDTTPIQAAVGKRQSMLFDDHELLWQESAESLAQAKETLKTLCTTASRDVRPDTPDHFAELVYELKRMSANDLKSLIQEAKGKKDCPKAIKFVTDALPNCGTTGCVTIMADVLSQKVQITLSPMEEKNFFAGLALTAHPTKDMVKAVTGIVATVPAHGLFGITAMVNGYCRLHPECDKVDEVKQFVKQYLTILTKYKANAKVKDPTFVNTIEALRAFGNLGYTTEGSSERIRFFTETRNHMDVRLAALQSLRRTPLTEELSSALFTSFDNDKDDVEIRLVSFMLLMKKGPEISVLANVITSAFKDTQLNQIQSFVSSYLRQVRDSKDPSKEDLQDALAKVSTRLPAKGFDPRKYSRYYESSDFNYDYNVGYHTDSAVIFSTDSYLPKQTYFNFTVDLFGSEINLFELGFRSDNLADVFDSVFGPEGSITNSMASYNKATQEQKKSIKNPLLKTLQDGFDANKKPKTGLDLSMYLRVFGDEVIYKSMYDTPIETMLVAAMNPSAVPKMLSGQQDFTYAVYKMPVDSVFTVGGLSGFPLRFDINGTVAINIDVSSKLDVAGGPTKSDVLISMKPSAASELAVQLAIWTGKVKSGVRTTKSMHTSTSGSLNFQMKNKDTVKLSLEVPNQKEEIISIETHLYTIVNDVATEEKGIAQRSDKTVCTPENWGKALGFKLCTHAAGPQQENNVDMSRLMGPMDFDIYAEKTDTGLKSYELNAVFKNTPEGRNVKVSLNTPGSQVDREVTFDYNYVRGKSLNLDIKTPVRKIKAAGVLEPAGNDKTKGTITVNVDQSKEYKIMGTMEKTVLPDNGKRYVFDAQVTAPNLQTPGSLKATAERTPGKQASIDLKINNVFPTPVELKSTIIRSTGAPGSKYSVNSDWKGPKLNLKLTGSVNVQNVGNMDYELELKHQRPGTDQTAHTITYKHKHTFQRTDKSFAVTSNSKFTSSWYPDFNDGYDFSVEKTQERFSLQATFMDNDQKGLSYNQVTLTKPGDCTTTATLQYPKLNINEKAVIQYKDQRPREFLVSVTLEDVTAKKEAKALVRYTNKRQDMVDFDGEVLLKTPQKEIRVTRQTKQTNPTDYESTTVIQWEPTSKATIKSTFKGMSKQDWELKANIVAEGAKSGQYEFFKKFKRETSGSTKVITYLKSGPKTFWDFNLDSTKEDDTKTNFKSTFKFDDGTMKVDAGVNGFYENLPNAKRVTYNVLKDGRDYMKAEVIWPKEWKRDSDRQIKISSIWGLQDQPKEISYEHKKTKSGNAHIHDITTKIDVPDVNYKLDIKTSHDQKQTVEIKLAKKSSPLLEITASDLTKIDAQKGEYVADLAVKTFAPMPVRNMVGKYAVNVADKGVTADLTLSSVTDNQNLNMKFGWERKDENTVSKSVSITANDYKASTKSTSSVQRSGSGEVNGYNSQGESEWTVQNQNKKVSWNIAATKTKLDAQFTTSSATYPKVGLKIEKNGDEKKQNRLFELTYGNEKITAKGNKETDDQYYNADISVDSTLPTIKKYQHTLKYDFRRGGREAVLNVNWNDANKIGANFVRKTEGNGDEKWGIGAQAKVGAGLDWQTTTDATWNVNTGKYETHNLIKTNPSTQYKADVDLNTKTMEAKVNMENIPGIKSPVKAQAKKIADGEYELSLIDSANANQGKIGFKLTNDNQKFKIDTTAFKANYESEWQPTKWSVLGEVITDPNAPSKSYGVKVSTETADSKTRDTMFSFSYPERKLSVQSKRVSDWPNIYQNDITANLNVGKREPTKVSVSAKPNALEFHFTNPKLPAGFHIVGKHDQTGDITKPNSDFSSKIALNIKYSSDPTKEIVITKNSERKLVNQRLQMSSSTSYVQAANNMNHAINWKFLLDPCDGPMPTKCEYVLAAGFKFPDKQRQQQEYSIDMKSNEPLKATALVNVGTNKYNVDITGRDGQVKYAVSKNNAALYDVIMDVVRHGEKTAALSILKKPNDDVIFHASASLPAIDLATIKVYHDESGKTVKDLEFSMKLEESDRLRVKMFKRPGLRQALQDAAKKLVPADGVQAALPTWGDAQQAVGQDIVKELKPVFDDWIAEEGKIAQELQLQGGKVSESLRDEVAAVSTKFNNFLQQMNTLGAEIAKNFQNVFRAWIDTVKSIVAQFPQITTDIGPTINEIKTKIQARFTMVCDRIKQTFGNIVSGLKLDEVYKFVSKSWNEVPNAGIVQRIQTLLKNLHAILPEGQQGMLADLKKKLTDIWNERSRQGIEAWKKLRDDLSKNPNTQELAKFIDTLITKVQEYFNKAQTVATGEDPVARTKLIDWARVNIGGKGFVYETPEEGTVVIEIPLWDNFHSLKDLGKSFTPDRLKALAHQIEDSTNQMAGMLTDDDSSDWVEPHHAEALIFGEQYFETFDGELITFAGDCSYLLARDFENLHFTVSVDFEQRRGRAARKSITVEYDTDKIEFLYDGKVNINGKTGELPWQHYKSVVETSFPMAIKVEQVTDDIVMLETFDGLTVKCDSHYHLCSIKLKGRFHGKTRGLLGKNDGEPNDDLTLPNGNRAANVGEFASAYALDQKCARGPNRAVEDVVSEQHAMNAVCQQLFVDPASPLKRCFRSTPPEEFQKICLQYMKNTVQNQRDESRQPEGACEVTAAYLETCGQTIDMPTQCIQCAVPEPLKLYETKQVKGDLIDIVFIVEERQCNAWAKTKLVTIAQKLETTLKNVHYGLIGFNGKGVHQEPHFHTGSGAVNMDVKGLQLAVTGLEIADVDPKPLKNPMEAIEFASEKFPFRGGSRKLLAMLNCNNCEGFEIDYYILQGKLFGEDIGLSMIQPLKVEMTESKVDVIGFDGSVMITADKREDAELRKQLVEPHDSCTVLAQETHGTVFAYSDKNANAIVELFAARLAKIAVPPRCAICECRSDDLHSHTVCLPCEIPAPASLTKDNSGFFNNPAVKLNKWQNKAKEIVMADAPAADNDDLLLFK